MPDRFWGGFKVPDERCPIEPEMGELTASIKVLVERIDTLIQLNRDIIKWLLVVVCIIALGRSALDVSKEFLTRVASAAHAKAVE